MLLDVLADHEVQGENHGVTWMTIGKKAPDFCHMLWFQGFITKRLNESLLILDLCNFTSCSVQDSIFSIKAHFLLESQELSISSVDFFDNCLSVFIPKVVIVPLLRFGTKVLSDVPNSVSRSENFVELFNLWNVRLGQLHCLLIEVECAKLLLRGIKVLLDFVDQIQGVLWLLTGIKQYIRGLDLSDQLTKFLLLLDDLVLKILLMRLLVLILRC